MSEEDIEDAAIFFDFFDEVVYEILHGYTGCRSF